MPRSCPGSAVASSLQVVSNIEESGFASVPLFGARFWNVSVLQSQESVTTLPEKTASSSSLGCVSCTFHPSLACHCHDVPFRVSMELKRLTWHVPIMLFSAAPTTRSCPTPPRLATSLPLENPYPLPDDRAPPGDIVLLEAGTDGQYAESIGSGQPTSLPALFSQKSYLEVVEATPSHRPSGRVC